MGGNVEFYMMYVIRHLTSSVVYPQADGQAKNMIWTIMYGLKNMMDVAGTNWAEDLQYILWTYQTTPRKAIAETPFAPTYGFEAKVLVEVLQPTRRVEEYEDDRNE